LFYPVPKAGGTGSKNRYQSLLATGALSRFSSSDIRMITSMKNGTQAVISNFLASLMKIKHDLRLHHRAGGCHYLRFEMVETDIVGLPNPICQLELLVNILCGNKTTRKALKLP